MGSNQKPIRNSACSKPKVSQAVLAQVASHGLAAAFILNPQHHTQTAHAAMPCSTNKQPDTHQLHFEIIEYYEHTVSIAKLYMVNFHCM